MADRHESSKHREFKQSVRESVYVQSYFKFGYGLEIMSTYLSAMVNKHESSTRREFKQLVRETVYVQNYFKIRYGLEIMPIY